MIRFRFLIFFLLALAFPWSNALAQQSNLATMASLAESCLGPLTDEMTSFSYEQTGGYRFLETGIVSSWVSKGKTVQRQSSLEPDQTGNLISFEVQDAQVRYDRQAGSSLARTVEIRLSGIRFENGTAITSVTECPGSFTDIIDRDNLKLIEDGGIPETQGAVPKSGFLKRFGQPIVVGAASAVAVYLFFSIRSDEASN